MARRIRDNNLETRSSREKLRARGKPYFRAIAPKLHLGYRKNASGGKWLVRRYDAAKTQYQVETFADADDLTDGDGVRVLDFWQAQDKARELGGQKKAGPYTVAEAVEDYLVGKAYDTRNRLHANALPALGHYRVDALTADILRDWHRRLAELPPIVPRRQTRKDVNQSDPEVARKRKCSANRVLTLLKAALNYAFAEKKVESDSEWRRVKPFKDVERSRATYLTFAECERLQNACEPEFRNLVRGALETGARYGELCRLRVGDYNRNSKRVHIQTSKSGEGRYIVLTPEGAAVFESLTVGRAPTAPMFGREWAAGQQVRRMKEACKRAGIAPAVGFHQLRHTWASHAVMGGLPWIVVARNLGHVDTRMVEKHYGHLSSDFMVEAIQKHGPRFGDVEPSNVRSL